MDVVITGYTYTRENLFDVFESYPEKENLHFILPNNWTAKDGRVKFKAFKRSGFDISHSPSFFAHSNYPLIGGLMKGWMPFMVFRLIRLRALGKADILFTTGEPNLISTTYNAILAKLLGMKHVFHFWENIPYEEKDKGLKLIFKKGLIRLNLALSDGAICGMHKAEDILKKFDSGIHVETFLHAGFDPDKFKPGIDHAVIDRELDLNGKKVFLFVGALGYRKGLDFILEALADIKSKEPDVRLIIIGSGEYHDILKSKIKNLNLEDTVIMIPWLDNKELPAYFNAADVFLYPSIRHQGWEEQFGYSIAEASLCGLPVISTATGSIDEVLVDGVTGIMINPGSEADLKEAMLELMNNEEKSKYMGQKGREFIKENFSNEIIAQKMYKFFDELQ